MIPSVRVQEMFQATVIHLTSEKYNFFEYNGKLKNKKQTIFSDRISRRFDNEEEVLNFFVANHIHHFVDGLRINTFIGNFCDPQALDVWKKYDGYKSSYKYHAKNEAKLILQLGEKAKDFHEVYSLFLDGKVSVNTLCNFMYHLNAAKHWNVDDDPLLVEVMTFLKRISSFVLADKKNFMDAIQKARAEL